MFIVLMTFCRLSWAGLLPLARMVECTDDEEGPADPDHGRSRRFPFDHSLLTALVDRWRPETHTFHFRWGEMTVTLQDVACLLGLPIRGDAVGPTEAPNDWHLDLAARFAGVLPGILDVDDIRTRPQDRHGPRVQWLRQYEVSLLATFCNKWTYHGLCSKMCILFHRSWRTYVG
jgi:mobile domain-containing protein